MRSQESMKRTITLLSLSLGLTCLTPSLPSQAQLAPINLQESGEELGVDEQLWSRFGQPGDKYALVRSIDNSLRYLNTPSAAKAYEDYPVPGVTLNRVRRSLKRFRHLLLSYRTPEGFQNAVEKEFVFYKSVGRPSDGEVLFTAYYEPIYSASRVRTEEYRYPLYRKPTNFDSWQTPHPTREEIEGKDGLLGSDSQLSGYEIAWFKDRLEAFLVQIQGSASLQLTDGSTMTVGFDGGTDYPYTSVGKELINDGILPSNGLTLPVLIEYFRNNPQQLSEYIPRNNRFVFLRETNGAPPRGSIGVPITPDRSIATDKALMPPGALALVRTRIPYYTPEGVLITPEVSRYVMDQDTGSAIKTPGRVDLFLGTGPVAGDRAGVVGWKGSLYYPLLKN